MSLSRLLRRCLYTTSTTSRSIPIPISLLHRHIHNNNDNTDAERSSNPYPFPTTDPSQFHTPQQSIPYSSAEELAAERRRRKRRLRIEPPLHALRRDPSSPPPKRDPNAPRLPDSTSALVGQRLNLHNRVQSLIRASDLDAASKLARQSVFSNTRPTVFTCNAIIAAMYRAKRYSDSVSLFEYFFKQSNIVPNVVSYNQIINAHCDDGKVDEALELYNYILANSPFSPSSVTYRHLTKGLVQAGRIDDAASLLREMLNKGQAADSIVYNNLIKGYLDLGEFDKANEFFDELQSKCTVYDGIVNATFMEYWFEKGKDKEAMESYKSLLDKNFRMHPPTGNVILEVFLKYGKKSEAWELFNEMLDNHTPPNILSVNSETISIMVNECFKMGQFEEAIDTFKKVGSKPKSRPFVMDYVGYCNIVTRFCEHGMLPEAERLFAEGVAKSLPADAPSHRAMIDAYLKAERIEDAVKMLERMVDVNLRVVADFGTRVFGEMIRNGKFTECVEILSKMGEKEPKPDASVYDVVVRGLCDGGVLDQAKDVVGEMVGYGVGVTPELREFIIESFEKVSRREEIEKTLNTVNRPVRTPRQSGNTPVAAPPQQVRNRAPWESQGAGAYTNSNGQNASWSNNTSVNNQHQQSWSNQTARQQPSQTPGYQQQQGWSSPAGQQPSWTNHGSGHQQPYQEQWPNQNRGQQQQWTNQQQPWANHNTSHQQQWTNQTADQQQTWANQSAGQQPAWSGQQQQQQWSNHQQSQWSNPTSGHVANQAPWSHSTDGHRPQQQHESGSSNEWQDGEEKKIVVSRN